MAPWALSKSVPVLDSRFIVNVQSSLVYCVRKLTLSVSHFQTVAK